MSKTMLYGSLLKRIKSNYSFKVLKSFKFTCISFIKCMSLGNIAAKTK
jgi:hypothetical protein